MPVATIDVFPVSVTCHPLHAGRHKTGPYLDMAMAGRHNTEPYDPSALAALVEGFDDGGDNLQALWRARVEANDDVPESKLLKVVQE